jgi:membrane associated rhomboid family serine protease
MFSFLNNIPPVTKNLLILNVLMFILTLFFESQGTDLHNLLGSHYVISPLFEPYQIITHFFIHDGLLHLLFNMLFFVMLGSHVERVWGARRFFLFYIACGVGAYVLYNTLGIIEVMRIKEQLTQIGFTPEDFDVLNNLILRSQVPVMESPYARSLVENYFHALADNGAGASGSVYGVLVAFAILFPTVEFMLYFLFPVKAWILVSIYVGIEVVKMFNPEAGDLILHVGHVGGALTGAILAYLWKRKGIGHY